MSIDIELIVAHDEKSKKGLMFRPSRNIQGFFLPKYFLKPHQKSRVVKNTQNISDS